MEKTGWKIMAWVFLALFVTETAFIIYAVRLSYIEQEKDYECAYDVCGEYPYGERLEGICYCYDYDVLGELQIAKTEYIK